MKKTPMPQISVILPCYNEESILAAHLDVIISYLKSEQHKYKWEIIVVNDGSIDNTGKIANEYALNHSSIRVFNHPVNLNLGHALQTGFSNAKGEIFVVLDIDLSYSTDHIIKMVDTLITTCADIVVASPYMKGGKVTAVPFFRRIMSYWVNKFLRMASQEKFHTYTGMVRAYRKEFITKLNLKTTDYEINPEILYKGMILRARIVEIPAHLDWTEQNKYKENRSSSIKVIRGVLSGMMSGFIFRPYIFFVGIGTILLFLSLYQLIWLLFDTLQGMTEYVQYISESENAFSLSLAHQFQIHPQTFLVGGITFIAAIQFLGLGFLSLQSKRYFEELFHLNTSLKNTNKDDI